jgi:hypothetical protein
MYTGATIFSQLMQHLPWRRFQRCVQRYKGDYKVKKFKCIDNFRVMAFAQLTYRESLRDIEACLRAMQSKLYHMGIHSTVSRNNLSNANELRDRRIYADFAQTLISEARILYADEELGIDLDASVYALDSTTIDLCLSMFPWASFCKAKGAIKLHTLLNLHGGIPEFILISEGKLHEVNVLDYLIPMPGAYYVMDRGYLDFERPWLKIRSSANWRRQNIRSQINKIRSESSLIGGGRLTPPLQKSNSSYIVRIYRNVSDNQEIQVHLFGESTLLHS